MIGFVFVFAFFCTDDVFSFCRFLQLFYNCYTVLMFALLVASWPFCINKFDLIILAVMSYQVITMRTRGLSAQWRTYSRRDSDIFPLSVYNLQSWFDGTVGWPSKLRDASKLIVLRGATSFAWFIFYISRFGILYINQIKFICDKKEHNATQKNKANMSTGHKGSMKLH